MRKLEQLQSMGWTKKDIQELFNEILNKAFLKEPEMTRTEENQVSSMASKLIGEYLAELGLLSSMPGAIVLKRMLETCISKEDPNLNFKKELYGPIIKEVGIPYETVRCRARELLKREFKSPTLLGRTLFERSIEKRGYPTIKEFIQVSYDYIMRVLLENE